MLSARSAGSMRMPARFLVATPVATGWEAWLASARQVDRQAAREPQKRRAKALPGPLHLKGETQLASTPHHAGLILNGRLARIS
jgi:hypothetical protein